jgi:lipopolysaccharide transport system permease protein
MVNRFNIDPTQQVTRIEATRGWNRLNLSELWQFKDLLWFHTLKEIKSKYRQMALGPLWIILQPIVNMIIFTFVFGQIAKLPSEGIPYPIFTYVALLPWILFQNACSSASNSLVQQMPVISKVYFPRLIIPIGSTLSWLIDFAISFCFLIFLMLCFGIVPCWQAVFVPFFLLLGVAFALGVGFSTAGIAVKYRDIQYVVTYGLRAFMFLTPVAYSGKLIPDKWQWLYQLNPMFWVIEGFRWSMLGTFITPNIYMIWSIFLTIGFLIFGIVLFKKAERTVVDLL